MKRIAHRSAWSLSALLSGILLAGNAQAAPIAYLRFDNDGSAANSPVTPLPATSVIDAADNDDNFAAFSAANAPTYRSDVPGIPQGALTNTLSLDPTGGKDVYSAVNGPLRTTVFSEFTIEAWVKFSALSGFQTIVGRDDTGNPGERPGGESLFYLQKTNTNFLRFLAPAADGTYVSVADTTAVVTGQWYHVAVVGDGTDVTLYKNGTAVGTAPFAGGLYDPAGDTTWTVGRGQYNGGVGDFVTGLIDEVRWSDNAMAPSEFLSVPEPSGLGLLLGAGLLALRRRRRA